MLPLLSGAKSKRLLANRASAVLAVEKLWKHFALAPVHPAPGCPQPVDSTRWLQIRKRTSLPRWRLVVRGRAFPAKDTDPRRRIGRRRTLMATTRLSMTVAASTKRPVTFTVDQNPILTRCLLPDTSITASLISSTLTRACCAETALAIANSRIKRAWRGDASPSASIAT